MSDYDFIGEDRSVLDTINYDDTWEFFIHRRESINPDDPDIDLFKIMMNNPNCRMICREISEGTHIFSVPRKKMVPKGRGGKMRTVYQYDIEEMVSLKIVADRLYAYDYLFTDNLYSFRRNVHVADAVRKLFSTTNLDLMWGYKADIHNYFNSIPTDRILEGLRSDIIDEKLYRLFVNILSDSRVIYEDEIIEENKGVMAGIPISAFLANYYLRDLDQFFLSQDCMYMRYADDILILSDSEEKIMDLRMKLIDFIESKGLEMNPDKEHYFRPGEGFEFLGFYISKDCIDIGSNTIRKMKGRISRSARSIRRWMVKKDAPLEGTIRALIRTYNGAFYGSGSGEFSWSHWYFSAITTTDSLHEIDLFFQEWARYVASGRHTQKNKALVPYEMLKECGYRPLVSEYYKPRKPVEEAV